MKKGNENGLMIKHYIKSGINTVPSTDLNIYI